jgi:putative membrane protein
MQQTLRERVPLVTAVLSVVSIGVVFAAAGRRIPEAVLPPVPESVLAAVPHVNAVISVAAIVTIALGVRAIRNGDVTTHRRAMLASFGLFVAFLVLYLTKVAIAGPTSFTGPGWVETFVYYPVLAIHIVLAVVTIPLVYHALLLAATHDVAELRGTAHPRVGRLAAAGWLVSFSLGVVVYALLYL